MTDLDLTLEDAVGQARLVREGAVSSADLVTAAIARIEAVNPVINAVVTPLFELALSTASAPGPFQGVPFLLKDAGACLAGLPLYAGSGLLRSLSSAAPADTVLGARFRDAGFVFVGKTNLPEFGIQPTTQPLAFGPTRNPWDTSRSSGGSSGGAAAAVAAGMVPVAHAGDVGGSIRIPSAWCGVVGLKPSRGRTSTVPLVDPNMVEHVITRSVRDCAAVLDAVAGATETDVYQLPSSGAAYGGLGEPGPLRIGLMTHVDAGAIDVDPECVHAAERTGALLESLGHNVERAGPAALFDDEFATHSHAVMTREMKVVLDGLAATIGRPLVAADVEPYTWAMAAEGAAVTNDQYAQQPDLGTCVHSPDIDLVDGGIRPSAHARHRDSSASARVAGPAGRLAALDPPDVPVDLVLCDPVQRDGPAGDQHPGRTLGRRPSDRMPTRRPARPRRSAPAGGRPTRGRGSRSPGNCCDAVRAAVGSDEPVGLGRSSLQLGFEMMK